jgi:hypothetical protein
MPKRKEPSPRVLRRLIDYCPETGRMTWKERPVWMFKSKLRSSAANAKSWNHKHAGKMAFKATVAAGYRSGKVCDITTTAHRVAWAIYFGTWPDGEIDHINGIRADNRISNLRDVAGGENRLNMKRNRRNTSGTSGVSWFPRTRKWHAKIKYRNKQIHLGYFSDLADAVSARKAAEKKYGFHPNHGRTG